MSINPWKSSLPLVALPVLLLSGCKDEEQTKRIKELEEQVAEYDADLERTRSELTQAKENHDKVRSEVDQAKREAQNAKSQAQSLQQQLDSIRKAEQRQRELAAKEAARNPQEEARTAVQGKLAAIWQIVGDQKSTHGIVAESDGKTWFYFPANGLGSSSKLSIKDSAGNAVTKFGDFQVAADANLARLEIKQDVPTKFNLDPQAALGENPTLLAVNPAEDGKPQIIDCAPSSITATELELSLSGAAGTEGYPVFSADNGALVSITVPPAQAASSVWPEADAGGSGLLRAPRLNRAIDWKPAAINSLLAERRKIEELNKHTRLLLAATTVSATSKGLSLDASVSGGSQTAKQVFDDQKTAPGVQDLFKLNENIAAQKVRSSENDVNRQISGILGQFGSASQRCATEAKALKVTPANRRDLENALKWNEDALKRLNERISSFSGR